MDKIFVPVPMLELFNKKEGFTIDEFISLLDNKEVKEFLEKIKPSIVAILKKEFPFFGAFIK